MIPTIGRIVSYTLTKQDADWIRKNRQITSSFADRRKGDPPGWPEGAQAHIGNEAEEGQVYPMLIVRVWGSDPTSAVNGQVFLDGSDTFWVTSVSVGNNPGYWKWNS